MGNYTTANLLEDTGLPRATLYVKLREMGIEKAGKGYKWTRRSEYKEVLSQLKAYCKSRTKRKAKIEDGPKPKAQESKLQSTKKSKRNKDAGSAPENKTKKNRRKVAA